MSSRRPFDQALEILSNLVRINSVNPSLVPGGAGEKEIAQFLAAFLKQQGIPAELLGKPYILQSQPLNSGERAKHILPFDKFHIISSDSLGQRFVISRVRRSIYEKQVLFRRPNDDVEFPVPAVQRFNIGPR